MSIINLNISIGEAIDKLTILEIKKEQINDERLNNILNEYNYLYPLLQNIVDKYLFFYNILKKINEDIWKFQDKIRLINHNDKNYAIFCENIILLNDSRYLVKQKINKLVKSTFMEEKNYIKRNCYIISHLGLGDNITMIGAVRLLSIIYDTVNVFVKDKYIKNVSNFYMDDLSIKLISVDTTINELLFINQFINKNINKNDDFLVSGIIHKQYFKSIIKHPFLKYINEQFNNDITNYNTTFYPTINNLVKQFYDNIEIPFKYYSEYFYIPETENSINLYNQIKHLKIIFTHTEASNTKINFNFNEFINNDEYIIISANKNEYNIGHKYYDIAEKYINIPIIDYISLILNANKIMIIDSCFSTIIYPLKLRNKLKTEDIKIIIRQ